MAELSAWQRRKGFVTLSSTAESGVSDPSAELDPAILLVDMDSFFASVEVRGDPTLVGLPVLVGGDSRRGVVASCTYEARRFGIHSAMPMATAKRLCPDAIVLSGDIARYAAVSRELHSIFKDVTPLVEPLGLDEAFLDVTGSRALFGTPLEIARRIRSRVREELDLDCSVGVGESKLIAKLSSRDAKPKITGGRVVEGSGVAVVPRSDVLAYLDRLPVAALFGVGPATAAKLNRLGIEWVPELRAIDGDLLAHHLGSTHAASLHELAWGRDPRPVTPDVASKSVGHEETFLEDVPERDVLERRLRRQAVAVAGALRDSRRRARTVTVKVKLADLSSHTRSHTLLAGIDDHRALEQVAVELLGDVEVDTGVRLLGLIASNLQAADEPVQLQLLMDSSEMDAGATQQERAALEDAVAEIRSRFGRSALGTAGMLAKGAIHVPGQRDIPFGSKDPSS